MNQFRQNQISRLPPTTNCVVLRAQSELQTKYGLFKQLVFQENNNINRFLRCARRFINFWGWNLTPWLNDAYTHIALVAGEPQNGCLVRIHSECLSGDVFGSLKCDCGEQFVLAQKEIQKEGCGIIIYMRQEGRNIGLVNKVKAYELQKVKGYDTIEANLELGLLDDAREYNIESAILCYLGISNVRLITNNPKKVGALTKMGIINKRVPTIIEPNEYNVDYINTKRKRMGHFIPEQA